MTCRRRYLLLSAWGSSRVLIIGRDRVVALLTPSHTWSARWLIVYPAGKFSLGAPLVGIEIFPAPQISWRVTKMEVVAHLGLSAEYRD